MKKSITVSRQKQTGFTLIELLVVIAMIAILAAILFPVFARARENARRTSCVSNLKQIGLGIMQYTQDYDERYPLPVWQVTWPSPASTVQAQSPLIPGSPAATFGSAGNLSWRDFIFPYVKSVQIFVCPSWVNPYPATWINPPSYGYSQHISGWKSATGSTISIPPRALADVARASEIVMVLDYPYVGDVNPSNYCSNGSSGFLNPASTYHEIMWPHLEGGTVTFADGHAKWYKKGSTAVCRVASAAASNQRAWDPTLP